MSIVATAACAPPPNNPVKPSSTPPIEPPGAPQWPTVTEPTPFPENWDDGVPIVMNQPGCKAVRVREWLRVSCRSLPEARITGMLPVLGNIDVACVKPIDQWNCTFYAAVTPTTALRVVVLLQPGDVQVVVDVAWPKNGAATEANVLTTFLDRGPLAGECRAAEYREPDGKCLTRCGSTAPCSSGKCDVLSDATSKTAAVSVCRGPT